MPTRPIVPKAPVPWRVATTKPPVSTTASPATTPTDEGQVHRPKPPPRLREEPEGRLQRTLAVLADLVWLVQLVARQAPRQSALWAAFELARGLLVPAQLWLTKALVDALAAAAQGGASEGLWPLWPVWLGLLAATVLAERALSGALVWLQTAVRERAGAGLQEQAMRHGAGLDLAELEHQAYYDQLSRVLSGVESRGLQVLQRSIEMMRVVPTVLGYAAGLAMLSPLLMGVALASRGAAVLAFVAGGRATWTLHRDQTRDRRLGEYYASVLTDRTAAKEVRLYGLAPYLLDRWSALFWRTRDEQRRRRLRIDLKQRFTLTGSTAISLAALLWLVASGSPDASPGDFALLFQSFNGLAGALFALSGIVGTLGEQSGFSSECRAFLRRPTEVLSATGTAVGSEGERTEREGQPLRQPFPRPLARGICFEEVWFTYPGAVRPAVAGASFEIAAGEKVALVGENGAGKTTLVKLLLGLYRPDAGRITVDGIDLRDLDPQSIRAATAAVFQHFVRYQLTLRENVALGATGTTGTIGTTGLTLADSAGQLDPSRVQAALEGAGAADIAARLRDGWETLLGPDVGGTDLSGGQWQRLALARAFYREAELLVLDEPTAALDPLAELALFERFVEMAKGRTAVLISHRLGIARLADRVLVLSRGRVAEAGTHDALLRANGEYAALFAAQARWYT